MYGMVDCSPKAVLGRPLLNRNSFLIIQKIIFIRYSLFLDKIHYYFMTLFFPKFSYESPDSMFDYYLDKSQNLIPPLYYFLMTVEIHGLNRYQTTS